MKPILNRDYEQDEYFKKWLIGLSPKTKKNYTQDYHEWHAFIGMTPTEQIKKRMQDLTTQDLTQRLFFEDKFRAYKEYLEQKGNLKHATVRSKLRTVASFFGRNGLPLALKRGDWEPTQQQPIIQRWKLTREEVKAMYAHANLRDRALLLILAQSGLSEIDVSQLRIEQLKGLYEHPEAEHYYLEKPREKTNETQATCISYEALHDIKAMLKERGNPREGYLFVSATRGKGDKLEVRSIHQAMKSLAEKAFGQEKAKEFKTKALRSFYNSALLRAELTQEIKDLMMGHARQSARKHYDYDEVTIKEAYNRAFQFLSINGFQVREDIKKLMDALQSVEETNMIIQRHLDAKDSEIAELKRKLSDIEQNIRIFEELVEGKRDRANFKIGKIEFSLSHANDSEDSDAEADAEA
ncbi:MAG: tyrosine-type recombinase/integrase [Candidatus Bathyarchaeia archaeon]